MLGIITEVTVKLIPKPEKAQVVMVAFDDIRKAGNAVANVIGAGIIPAGMEMMDKIAIHAVEGMCTLVITLKLRRFYCVNLMEQQRR